MQTIYFICLLHADCKKLDEWKTLLVDDLASQKWYESSSDSEESDSEEESNDDDYDEPTNINKD